MEDSDVKHLAETVEAGLRDGRSLESIRVAMMESGYGDSDVRSILSQVDRKKTIRKPQRKKSYDKGWAAASVAVIVVLFMASYIMMSAPPEPETVIETVEINENISPEGVRTCYVLNESVKEVMIEAGADCDKWFLIKEI